MPAYRCFGLTISSDLDLPELDPAPAALASAPDVDIVRGTVSPPAPAEVAVAPELWRGDGYRRVGIDGVATYTVAAGRHVVVDEAPGVDPADVRLFLLGTVLGAVLMDRGHLVLHGTAVRVDGGCVVVVGHSGAGKSTLAAEFARRGYAVLSDDVVPVTEDGSVLPGYPSIKLWGDALERLGRSSAGLRQVRAGAPKFSVPVSRPPLGPLPLRAVFVLDTHDGPALDLVPAAGLAKFALLTEHTYRLQWIDDAASAWAHARLCAAVGARAGVWRVLRPAASRTPAQTMDALLDHLHRVVADVGGETA